VAPQIYIQVSDFDLNQTVRDPTYAERLCGRYDHSDYGVRANEAAKERQLRAVAIKR